MPSRLSTLTAWLSALAAVIGLLLIAHLTGKLPEDPPLAAPWEMFDNLAFLLAAGLGLPYPKLFAVLLLLLAGWLAHRFGRWLSKKLLAR